MKLFFISKRHEASDVYSFEFAPEQPVTWVAGQSIRLEIEGLERRFSIMAAHEKNIMIATRLSNSDFKLALTALQPGAKIDGFNIEGTFVWQDSLRPHLLLASGVGITPYIAMFKQLAHNNQPLNATLLYANRDDEFLFGETLERIQTNHPELRLEFLPGQWLGREIIAKHHNDLRKSLVYLSGPEVMVDEVTPLLLNAGVKKTRLKLDIFTGRPGWEN